MLLYNVWYFFYFGGMVCVWPYLNILYRRNGLTDAQIGILAAVKPWTSAPASFLWSGLADRFSAHKTIMMSTFVISTLTRTSVSVCHTFVAFFILSLLGEFLAAPVGVMADAAVVAACKRDTDYGKSRLWGAVAWGSLSAISGAMVSQFGMWSGFLAYVVLSIPCVVCAWHMDFKLGAQHSKQTQQPNEQQEQQQRQQLQAKCTELQSTAARKFSPVQDSMSAPELGMQDYYPQKQQDPQSSRQGQPLALTKLQDGQQKLSHNSGTGADEDTCNANAGADADARALLLNHSSGAEHSSTHSQHHVQLVFESAKQQQQGLLHCLEQASSDSEAQQDQLYARKQQQHQQPPKQEFWRGLRQLLTTPAVLIFMWQATVMGFGIGVIGEFLFLFLQDLGGNETLMGLTLTVTCIAEVPMFHFQPQILKIVSVHSMLHFVMWTYTVRMGLYALLPYMGTAWAVLPIELLHGVTFGCGWSAGTITSKRVAPLGLEATMQGIFQGLYFGVGQGLGALIGGQLKQRHGGQAMFAMCACIVLAGWVLCVAAEQLTNCAESFMPQVGQEPRCDIQREDSEQLRRFREQHIASSWQQRLRSMSARIMGRANGSSDNIEARSDTSRQRKYKYAGLASKDSGPDLHNQLGLSGTMSAPDNQADKLTSHMQHHPADGV